MSADMKCEELITTLNLVQAKEVKNSFLCLNRVVFFEISAQE